MLDVFFRDWKLIYQNFGQSMKDEAIGSKTLSDYHSE